MWLIAYRTMRVITTKYPSVPDILCTRIMSGAEAFFLALRTMAIMRPRKGNIMALSENEFVIKRVMDDCSAVSEQVARILNDPELHPKVVTDLAACVDVQNI